VYPIFSEITSIFKIFTETISLCNELVFFSGGNR
jgi:hypothetical protein